MEELSDGLQQLYKQTCGQLESLDDTGSKPDAPPEEIADLRKMVRGALETLLIESPDFAAAQSLDVKLWKSCFYTPIREFRGKLARVQRTGDEKAVAKVSKGFASFLDEAAAFYMGLLRSLETRRRREDPTTLTQTVKATLGSLVYAGDIARYRVQYEDRDGGKKNWDRARTCYKMAIQIAPWSGNPHNQLGVVAVQIEDDFEAVYRYMRAILAEEPFGSAVENLSTVLRKGVDDVPVISAVPSLPDFLSKFLHVYKMIHGLDRTQLRNDAKANSTLRSLPPLIRTAASDLCNLCKNGQVADEHMLKVFAVCMFGLTMYNVGTQRKLGKSNVALSEEVALLQRLSCMALSFSLLRAGWSFYEKRVERIDPEEDRVKVLLARRTLGPLLIFSRWILNGAADDWKEFNVHRAEEAGGSSARQTGASFDCIRVWDVEGLKEIATEDIWECFRHMSFCKEQVLQLTTPEEAWVAEQPDAYLPEYVELRGYQPANAVLQAVFDAVPLGLITYTIPEKSEAHACAERLWHLEHLEVPENYGVEAREKTEEAVGDEKVASDQLASKQVEDSEDSDEEDIVFSVGFGEKSVKRPRPLDSPTRPEEIAGASSRQSVAQHVGSRVELTQTSSQSQARVLPTADQQNTPVESAPIVSEPDSSQNSVREGSVASSASESKVNLPRPGEVQLESDVKHPPSSRQNSALPFASGSAALQNAWVASNPFGVDEDDDMMNTQDWVMNAEEKTDKQKGLAVPPGFELAE